MNVCRKREKRGHLGVASAHPGQRFGKSQVQEERERQEGRSWDTHL